MLTKIKNFGFSRWGKPVFISPKIQYCHRPMIEGQYGVVPPGLVPAHIVRPEYVSINFTISLDSPNPVFGLYEGDPVKHD